VTPIAKRLSGFTRAKRGRGNAGEGADHGRGAPDRRFGVIPIGIHTLHFEKIDHNNYEIQSRERDPLIARWDHLVSVKPLDDGRSVFRDTIDIDASSRTFLVWAWANLFYRHRQRRWRVLAKTM
jgi:hypothetical protein